MIAAADATVGQASVVDVLRIVRAWYAPAPRLSVADFADRHIIITSGPLAGASWRTSFAPYQRGIMDAFLEPGITTVVVKGSSQWGKTACLVNVCAYFIAHDPCPILVVEPTLDPMAKDFSTNRLQPVIDATPVLSEKVSKKRSKQSSNTVLAKNFRGGSLNIAGANSAASLAARTVRLVLMDEIDRYPAELEGEGSTIAIAMKRAQSYRQRKRIGMFSSPTVVGAPIDAWHKRGDQRRFYVPCPECQVMHPYEWSQVRWTDDDPLTARLHCPACDYAINDSERIAVLSGGEWRPEAPDRKEKNIISIHLWEAYSPLSSLSEIVGNFLAAREKQKTGDHADMHTWQNTTLGEAVEPNKGAGVEPHVLLARREEGMLEPEVDVPAGACCLTAGVDVQDDRLEALITAWGPGEESWLIDFHTLPGNTAEPEPWKLLDELLEQKYRHAFGQDLMIYAACVDSAGHRTSMVYDYAHKRQARRVYATIGRDGQRPLVSSPSQKRWGRGEREVPLYTIGVDAAKAIIVSRLKLSEKGPGYVHLPMTDWCDEEFCAQLTSEVLVKKFERGIPKTFWRKVRARNEMLDCSVLSLAALRLLNPKLPQMLATLEATRPKTPSGGNTGGTPAAGPRAVRAHRRRIIRSSYLG